MQKFDFLALFLYLCRLPSRLLNSHWVCPLKSHYVPSTLVKSHFRLFWPNELLNFKFPGVLTYNAKQFVSLFLISLSGLVSFSFQREFQFSENNILYFLCAFAVCSACMLIDWEIRNLDCKNFSLWCWWMADNSQSHSWGLVDFSTVCGYVLSFSQWIAVWGG